jgi:hypothetical protein
MTQAAFTKIDAGMKDALAIARGEAIPQTINHSASDAARIHHAARALLASLASGPLGAEPTIALRDLLQSPELQALSDATDAWERSRPG